MPNEWATLCVHIIRADVSHSRIFHVRRSSTVVFTASPPLSSLWRSREEIVNRRAHRYLPLPTISFRSICHVKAVNSLSFWGETGNNPWSSISGYRMHRYCSCFGFVTWDPFVSCVWWTRVEENISVRCLFSCCYLKGSSLARTERMKWRHTQCWILLSTKILFHNTYSVGVSCV